MNIWQYKVTECSHLMRLTSNGIPSAGSVQRRVSVRYNEVQSQLYVLIVIAVPELITCPSYAGSKEKFAIKDL